MRYLYFSYAPNFNHFIFHADRYVGKIAKMATWLFYRY